MALRASGKYAKAMCPRCAFKVNYLDLMQEWTGLWVCPTCFDAKHESIDGRPSLVDPQTLDHPYVDRDNDGELPAALSTVIEPTFGE